MLPQAIREAPIAQPVSATEMLVCVAHPLECPVCGTARAFFVLTKTDPIGPWAYACAGCAERALPAGQGAL